MRELYYLKAPVLAPVFNLLPDAVQLVLIDWYKL